MKSLILSLAVLFSASSFAMNVPSQFPSDSGWALAMISMACDVEKSDLDGLQGDIVKLTNGGVMYVASDANGQPVMKAVSKSTFIWAGKQCLAVNPE